MKLAHILLLTAVLGCLASATTNLVQNGDFSQTTCSDSYCIWTHDNYQPNYVPGWLPSPEIEIGYGSVYSNFLGHERVLELAPNSNSCVKQLIPHVPFGIYHLQFTYGARKNRDLNDSQFTVSFNGQKVGAYAPQDYNIHTAHIEIPVLSSCDYAALLFCGCGGEDNGFGAFITGVSLIVKPKPTLTIDPKIPQIDFGSIQVDPIEIQKKPISPVLYIQSHANACYEKPFYLEAGFYELAFDYRAVFGGFVHDSVVLVKWNGKVIHKIHPTCQDTLNFVLQIQALEGHNVLSFCSEGCPGESKHTIIVSNICFHAKPCLAQQFVNLVTNGDFEQNQCSGSFCIWNQHNFQTSFVPGWTPSPEIEIGNPSNYNTQMGSHWVAELDPNQNTCIKQRIPDLKAGRFTLNFDWAARTGRALETSKLVVKIDDRIVKTFVPADYEVHQEEIDFTIENPRNLTWLVFCGQGNSDNFGAVIDNVEMYFLDECLYH